MINRRNIVWLVPLLILLTMPLWYDHVADFLAPRGGYDPSYSKRKTDSHNFVMDIVRIIQSENGKITVEIEASHAATGKTDEELRLIDVETVIRAEDGTLTFISAVEGTYNTTSRTLVLEDEVLVIKPKDNYELYTDLLYYYDETQMVHCPGETKLLGDGIEIIGSSLDFDMITNGYDVGGRVKCKFSDFIKP